MCIKNGTTDVIDVFMGLNAAEFETLFKEKFKPLTAFAYKYVKDIDLAKEIVHEAFTKLWEGRTTIDKNKNIKSYLYTIVANLSRNYIRDNKKFVSTEQIFEWDLTPENFRNYAEISELSQAIIAAIDRLPKKMRQIFIMSRYDGLTHKQIAEKLNISPKTVENQIGKALKKLRKDLKIYEHYIKN